MPLYDYRCTVCSRLVEVMHPIGGNGPETCEECGGAMRKALSPPAIHFKGSGWAKKDAASAGRPAAKAADEGASKGSGGDTTKTGSASSEGAAATKSGSASE